MWCLEPIRRPHGVVWHECARARGVNRTTEIVKVLIELSSRWCMPQAHDARQTFPKDISRVIPRGTHGVVWHECCGA
jgi:hypothetical protein